MSYPLRFEKNFNSQNKELRSIIQRIAEEIADFAFICSTHQIL